IARIYGYNVIQSTLPAGGRRRGGLTAEQRTARDIISALVGSGLHEIETYSFVDAKEIGRMNLPADSPLNDAVALLNPLSEGQSVMRTSLLPGILKVVRHNVYREQMSVPIFEVGKVFRPKPGASLPDESLMLGIALTGPVDAGAWHSKSRKYDFYDLKGVIEHLVVSIGIGDWEFSSSKDERFHPGRSAGILIGGVPAGSFGELHPVVQRNYDISSAVMVAEISHDLLVAAASEERYFTEIPKYPAISMDVALVVDESAINEGIVALAGEEGGDLLESVVPFDVFRGGAVPEGKKSVAYTMTYRAPDRTLTDDEAKAVQSKIIARLERELGASVRAMSGLAGFSGTGWHMEAEPRRESLPLETDGEDQYRLETVRISLKKKALGNYAPIVGREVIDEVRRLAHDIRGIRVLHINSTASGGGVAELLTTLVPLEVSSGIEAEWKIFPQHPDFFKVTKLFHNALQGMAYDPNPEDEENYLEHNKLAAEMDDGRYDVVIAHDPQPVAFRHFYGRHGAKWAWRCHIDTSHPNPGAWDFLLPYVNEYDAAIFTMQKFLPPGLDIPSESLFVVPPAIDPLATKNRDLPAALSREVLDEFGIDTRRPLLTQVSRFDPWKDPAGVIRIYRRVKKRVPGLQLALIGFMASDDPEAWGIYAYIQGEIKDDRDVFVFTNLNGVGSLEVNAFQRMSDVVIQKSIREGFGLVVSEAIWKGTPVVAGDTGGIPLQMMNGVGGFLANSEDEYVKRISYLLEHPQQARDIAAKGRAFVRERFLMTRMLIDELKMFRALVL
ncbi:MAG: glycosyltransferase, partial [Chloroflexi bacterium]|nr:glycosyltransferase [Chloroflexota bacterium]